MWSTSNSNGFRHIWGTDANGKQLISLCGRSAKGPLDYLKIHLSKCPKCQELEGKKNGNNRTSVTGP